MRLNTPEIAWHGKEPVYSVDFSKTGAKWRLASAGADNDVKMWSLTAEDGSVKIDFLSNLTRHTKSVNVVRFSPKDEILATGGDDCVIMLWKLGDNQPEGPLLDSEDSELNKENWTVTKIMRGHIEDVYDLAWSADAGRLISGSVDNSAIIWDVAKGQKLSIIKDSSHYVQGVTWDPLGQYFITQSSDRSCRVYNSSSHRCCYNISKMTNIPKPTEGGEQPQTKTFKMFADETMPSFFRRPSFTPDGSLLVVPAGKFDTGDQMANTTYVFTRGSMNKPVVHWPGPQKPSVAVRCCPILFEIHQSNKGEGDKNVPPVFNLPYRMVIAVATLDSVLLYDTQQNFPLGFISNMHYAALSDLTWSQDGKMLVVSSTDGYCSVVTFHDNELGVPYKTSLVDVLSKQSSEVGTSPKTSSDNVHSSHGKSPTEVQSTDSQAQETQPSGPVIPPPTVKPAKRITPTLVMDTFFRKEDKSSLGTKPQKSEAQSAPSKAPRRVTTTLVSPSTSPPIKTSTQDGIPTPPADGDGAVPKKVPRRITSTLISSTTPDEHPPSSGEMNQSGQCNSTQAQTSNSGCHVKSTSPQRSTSDAPSTEAQGGAVKAPKRVTTTLLSKPSQATPGQYDNGHTVPCTVSKPDVIIVGTGKNTEDTSNECVSVENESTEFPDLKSRSDADVGSLSWTSSAQKRPLGENAGNIEQAAKKPRRIMLTKVIESEKKTPVDKTDSKACDTQEDESENQQQTKTVASAKLSPERERPPIPLVPDVIIID